jgi:hypothetical protein
MTSIGNSNVNNVNSINSDGSRGIIVKKTGATISSSQPCIICGASSLKRCSRCTNYFYCGSEHQLQHWKDRNHSKECFTPEQALKIAETRAKAGVPDPMQVVFENIIFANHIVCGIYDNSQYRTCGVVAQFIPAQFFVAQERSRCTNLSKMKSITIQSVFPGANINCKFIAMTVDVMFDGSFYDKLNPSGIHQELQFLIDNCQTTAKQIRETLLIPINDLISKIKKSSDTRESFDSALQTIQNDLDKVLLVQSALAQKCNAWIFGVSESSTNAFFSRLHQKDDTPPPEDVQNATEKKEIVAVVCPNENVAHLHLAKQQQSQISELLTSIKSMQDDLVVLMATPSKLYKKNPVLPALDRFYLHQGCVGHAVYSATWLSEKHADITKDGNLIHINRKMGVIVEHLRKTGMVLIAIEPDYNILLNNSLEAFQKEGEPKQELKCPLPGMLKFDGTEEVHIDRVLDGGRKQYLDFHPSQPTWILQSLIVDLVIKSKKEHDVIAIENINYVEPVCEEVKETTDEKATQENSNDENQSKAEENDLDFATRLIQLEDNLQKKNRYSDKVKALQQLVALFPSKQESDKFQLLFEEIVKKNAQTNFTIECNVCVEKGKFDAKNTFTECSVADLDTGILIITLAIDVAKSMLDEQDKKPSTPSKVSFHFDHRNDLFETSQNHHRRSNHQQNQQTIKTPPSKTWKEKRRLQKLKEMPLQNVLIYPVKEKVTKINQLKRWLSDLF